MAEKQDYSQSELFTSPDNHGQYQKRLPKNSFFLRIRGYEKIMLMIIGLVLVSIISFSLGVEQGKIKVVAKQNIAEQSGYTIAVATFKNRQLALAEAKLLLKEGLTPLAFAKGDSIVLCVGKFSKPESAQPLLIQLQRTYAG